MLRNLAQGKPCWPQLHNHCAIALRQKRTESAVLIATARMLASSSHCSQFFSKIYRAGVKRALESALNVQTAHYLGRNQTLYPCCATRTGKQNIYRTVAKRPAFGRSPGVSIALTHTNSEKTCIYSTQYTG